MVFMCSCLKNQSVVDGFIQIITQRNETCDLDQRHPLHTTHTQRLRSLQQTPVLAGGPPPRYPGPRPSNPTKNWLKQADKYACYIATAFCP